MNDLPRDFRHVTLDERYRAPDGATILLPLRRALRFEVTGETWTLGGRPLVPGHYHWVGGRGGKSRGPNAPRRGGSTKTALLLDAAHTQAWVVDGLEDDFGRTEPPGRLCFDDTTGEGGTIRFALAHVAAPQAVQDLA